MADAAVLLLIDVAVVLAAAAVVTIAFSALRLPSILAYLTAGLLVGPHVLGLARNVEATTVLAELGVVFLMFGVGLEFSLRKLLGVGPLVLVAAGFEVLFMLFLGYGLGQLFGWSVVDSLVLGAVISITSTTILTKALVEMGMLRSDHAPVVLGLLVVEDVVAVLFLSAISTFGITGSIAPAALGLQLLQVVAFLVAAVAIGVVVVPRALDAIGRIANDEVLVVGCLALLLGVSLLAGELGFSFALGAFLVGAIVAGSKSARRVESRVGGLRDMFTAVFFVSFGMLIDPAILAEYWVELVVVSAAVLLGKVVAVGAGAFVSGNAPTTALRAGLAMAVIGEFSFVIADLGERQGLTSPFLFPLVVGVSFVTAFASPLLVRESATVARLLARSSPRAFLSYIHFYHRWASRLGSGPGGPLKGARRQLGRAVLHLGGVVGVLAAAEWAAVTLVAQSATPDASDARLAIAVWVGGALLALPFAVGFVRRSWAFVQLLSRAAVPLGDETTPASRVVRNTVGALATTALGGLALVATSPFLPPGPVLLVVVAAVGASLYFLGEAVSGMNRRVEDAIEKAVAGEPPEDRKELRRIIENEYPWAVDSARVTVPSDGFSVGLTLRELQVRNRTGATVAVVHRGAEHVLNPGPDWRLAPGDRLVVVGEPPQVQAALDLVRTPRPEQAAAQPAFREVEIPAGSTFVGRTLAETQLRERTGASVMGLARGGRRMPHPPPDQRLEAGDTVLLMGTADAVAKAAVFLREMPE